MLRKTSLGRHAGRPTRLSDSGLLPQKAERLQVMSSGAEESVSAVEHRTTVVIGYGLVSTVMAPTATAGIGPRTDTVRRTGTTTEGFVGNSLLRTPILCADIGDKLEGDSLNRANANPPPYWRCARIFYSLRASKGGSEVARTLQNQ